jgi:hypothetical protein
VHFVNPIWIWRLKRNSICTKSVSTFGSLDFSRRGPISISSLADRLDDRIDVAVDPDATPGDVLPKPRERAERAMLEAPKQRTKKKPAKKKPPKQLDRSGWYKQWENAIGPVVRLVDKIANAVGEKGGTDQEVVQEYLENATQAVADWMGVK